MGPLKKDPHGRGGRGRARGSWDHMSSNDVGSYELKRSPCEMQMEECSTLLPRTTSDGSADNFNQNNEKNKNDDNNSNNNNYNNNNNEDN